MCKQHPNYVKQFKKTLNRLDEAFNLVFKALILYVKHGDDTIGRVADSSGNPIGSRRSLFWVKYITCKIHNDDTALQMYLSERPNTVLRQSKYFRDCTKKYEYHSCTYGQGS